MVDRVKAAPRSSRGRSAPAVVRWLGAVLVLSLVPAGAALAGDGGLDGLVRDQTSSLGAPARSDAALDRAARRLGEAALDGRGTSLHTVLWDEGVRDAGVAPITLVADSRPPDAALRMTLQTAGVDWGDIRAMGTAVVGGGGRIAVTFLLSPGQATFDGGVVRLPGVVRARLVTTDPLGIVEIVDLLDKPKGSGTFLLPGGDGPVAGTWLRELEVKTGEVWELVALWPERIAPDEVKTTAGGDDSLGLGPGGLSTNAESVTAPDGKRWTTGISDAPSRAPTARDAAAAEEHLRRLLRARRTAAGLPPLSVAPATLRVARERSLAAVTGAGVERTVEARLLEAGLAPLGAEEQVVLASDPVRALGLLLARPESRRLLLHPSASEGALGLSLAPDWSVFLTFVRADLSQGDGTWEAVVQEHLRRARAASALPELLRRDALDLLAAEAAAEVAAGSRAAMTEERRERLVTETRRAFSTARGVGVEVLVTRDPSRAAERSSVLRADTSEVGIGVAEAADREAGFAIVLLFVRR